MGLHWTDCPKSNTCNASVCPLQPEWRTAVHRRGEQVCRYLLDTGKVGADEYHAGDPAYAKCRIALPLVTARFGDIRRRVAAAAKSGFRGAHLRRPRDRP